MKKIIFSLLAVAALAACTKTEVTYDAPAEIGFNVVAGNITKAVVDGTTYPTSLNMRVYAWTESSSAQNADYIANGEFKYRQQINGTDGSTNVWGGVTPYYWPNVNKLYFAGYSASGNAYENAAYDCQNDILTITDYKPGMDGANDLMWFPKTSESYGKETDYVPVSMYHTCAWITFLVKGDEVTSDTNNPYTITSLKMTEVAQKGTVKCSTTTTTTTTTTPTITWSNISETDEYTVTLGNDNGIALTETAKDVETDKPYAVANGITSSNIVVIPQTPGKLTLTYTYKSSTGTEISEPVTDLDLALAKDASDTEGPTQWEPGKHYIYTITIKANEILVAPTPVDWTDSNWNITVE